jgi:hypothetical protein
MSDLFKTFVTRASSYARKNADKEIAGDIVDLKYSKFLELVV